MGRHAVGKSRRAFSNKIATQDDATMRRNSKMLKTVGKRRGSDETIFLRLQFFKKSTFSGASLHMRCTLHNGTYKVLYVDGIKLGKKKITVDTKKQVTSRRPNE